METIKTKHTPGPWRWEKVSCNDGKDFQRLYGGNLRILTIRRSSTLRSANADLIAAAPELLEACKMVLENISRSAVQVNGGCQIEQVLKYAIRKAELGA